MIRRQVLAALLAGLCVGAHAQQLVAGELGRFDYRPPSFFHGKTLPVYHYKARTAQQDARVLFVIHGDERDARTTCSNWIATAEQYGLVLVAPEFGSADFPEALFQLGGMVASDEDHWTYGLIESLFDLIKESNGLAATGYHLFGHSAGGQFAHRLALMARQPRILAVVAANAGTYTMPTYGGWTDMPFPYTLSKQAMLEERLGAAFRGDPRGGRHDHQRRGCAELQGRSVPRSTPLRARPTLLCAGAGAKPAAGRPTGLEAGHCAGCGSQFEGHGPGCGALALRVDVATLGSVGCHGTQQRQHRRPPRSSDARGMTAPADGRACRRAARAVRYLQSGFAANG